MNKIFRIFVISAAVFILSGCTNVFKTPGDQPVKSPCESVCKKKPFYVNGKRIKA